MPGAVLLLLRQPYLFAGSFPNVYVDLAGDYYNNGLIDILADRLGADRILFGSDVDWVDTRCNLGPVIASGLNDVDVLKILRTNALKVFRNGNNK
jgi:uncharacterized protein